MRHAQLPNNISVSSVSVETIGFPLPIYIYTETNIHTYSDFEIKNNLLFA